MIAVLTEIKRCSREKDYGKVSNDILYDMCKRYPKHNDELEIIAKFWLIGRAYAASIERNKNRKEKVSDDFYRYDVAPKIKNGFDKLLSPIKGGHLITNEDVGVALKVHKDIMGFIREKITGDDKRSFVSKYLHFHFPNLFFIYDSRVAGVINDIVSQCGYSEEGKGYQEIANNPNYDKTYAHFFLKCFFLRDVLKKNNIRLTLREIDNYLIKHANKK